MKNRYTVVVKEITSAKGDYNRKRFNNVSPKIIKYLLKNNFSFMVGIVIGNERCIVNRETAENYIEVYEKSMFGKSTTDNPNDGLYNKLEKWSDYRDGKNR